MTPWLRIVPVLFACLAACPAWAAQCKYRVPAEVYTSLTEVQNVDHLYGICALTCTFDMGECGERAKQWCFTFDPDCDRPTGCSHFNRSSCPGPRPAAVRPATPPEEPTATERPRLTAVTESSPACPTHMRAEMREGRRICFCKSPKDTGGAASNSPVLMTEQQCEERFCGPDLQAATQACNVNTNQAFDPPPGGRATQEYCDRMNQAANSDATRNGTAAENCRMKINECNNACGAEKCQPLVARIQELGGRSLRSFADSDWGRQCRELAAAQRTPPSGQQPPPSQQGPGPQAQSTPRPQPQSQQPQPGQGGPGGGPGGGLPQMPSPTNTQDTSPQSSYLQRNLAEASAAAKTGLEPTEPDPTAEFNVGSEEDRPGRRSGAEFLGAPPRNPGIDKIPGRGGAAGGGVANNSGGQIPGGGGDSGGAKLGGKSGFGSPGAPGYTTDIMKGFQGGGGAGSAAAQPMKTDEEGGWTGYGNGRGPANEERGENLDLRNYLPGAKHDPGMKLGGFKATSVSGEINPMSVNHWNRITTRMQERCRLGLLYDCK